MSLFCNFHRRVACVAGAMLLGASLVVHADDMKDADKLFKQGKYDQALAKVDSHLASKPSDVQARFLKGVILSQQNKNDAAIAVFSALTEDFPELPEPYNNLAVLYAEQNNFDKARESLEMAIRTHPSYATAHENLGNIYAKLASKAYDRALQLDRGNSAVKTKLSLIQGVFDDRRRVETRNEPSETAATPARSSAEPETSSTQLDGEAKEVWSAVERWAAAWSAKDVQAYLAFYAPDFVITDAGSREAWEAQRQERITKPKFIEVKVSRPKVSLNGPDKATVQFKQAYNASHYKTSGNKTLKMAKVGNNWLIMEELSR